MCAFLLFLLTELKILFRSHNVEDCWSQGTAQAMEMHFLYPHPHVRFPSACLPQLCPQLGRGLAL